MAAFGFPGGVEAAAILSVVVMLFFPAIVVFGAGFLFGKKAAAKREDPQTHVAEQGSGPAGTTEAEPAAHAVTDGDADV